MKAFVLGTVLAVVLAVASGFILESFFGSDAHETFSTASARVGEENTADHRNFSGGGSNDQ